MFLFCSCFSGAFLLAVPISRTNASSDAARRHPLSATEPKDRATRGLPCACDRPAHRLPQRWRPGAPTPSATPTPPLDSGEQPHAPGNEPQILASAPRCGARTRAGAPCRSPAVGGQARCRMHGGKGSGAPRGNRNAFRHGARSGRMAEIARYLRLTRAVVAYARLRRSEPIKPLSFRGGVGVGPLLTGRPGGSAPPPTPPLKREGRTVALAARP